MSKVVHEDPRTAASLPKVGARRKSSTSEPGKTQLHTIIFFPIDYDDPHNEAVTEAHMADNSLSTRPHPHMVREPEVTQNALTDENLPVYFRDAHFHRTQRRLRSIYFLPRDGREQNFNEHSDTYAAEQGEGEDAQRFLHQMPAFMEMLKQKNFRTIYARNLQSALRHVRRLKSLLDPDRSPLEYKDPKTPNTPKTARSGTVPETPLTPQTVPDRKVMLLTYRMVGSRIHMDSRAYDAHMGESVLLYPSREEVVLDSAKVYDLRAFDALAKKYDQWRPRWHLCDLSGRTDCPFETQELRAVYERRTQILKRGHSSCTSKVHVVPWERHREPACYGALQAFNREIKDADLDHITAANDEGMWPGVLPKKAENHILHNARFYNYIHQEHVESLQMWGELRVFIAMKYTNDKDGIKGKPEVIDIIRTYFNTPDETVKIEEKVKYRHGVTDEDKGYGETYSSKRKDALRAYCRARNLPDDGTVPTLQGRLREDDGRRKQAPAPDNPDTQAPKPNDPNSQAPKPTDPDSQATTAVDEEPNMDDTTLINGTAGSPDEVPIVRCTYQSRNMNVARLNLKSTQGFPEYPKVTVAAITQFALEQYRRLHRRYPKQFESLNVGARVDIGIGPKQSLFINEVTRWWFASWFGGFEDIGRQHVVAEAFADSFAQVYRVDPPDVHEDDPESDAGDEDDYDDDRYADTAVLYKQKQAMTAPKRPRVGRAAGGRANGGGGGKDNGGGKAGSQADQRPQDDAAKPKKNTKNKKKKKKNPPRPAAQENGDGPGAEDTKKKKKKNPPRPAVQENGDAHANESGTQGNNSPRRSSRIAKKHGKRSSEENDVEETTPPRKKAKKEPEEPESKSTLEKGENGTTGG